MDGITITSDRRSIAVEAEVPGSAAQVWRAVASGAGVSAWFARTRLEERQGGSIEWEFGPGFVSRASVLAWDPPRRFAALGESPAPGLPGVHSEWTVEALASGTCRVRVVNSIATESDALDAMLASMEEGWRARFRVLKLYLAYHREAPCATIQAVANTSGSSGEAWFKLARPLGLAGAKPGQRVGTIAGGVPPFDGFVEHTDNSKHGHGVLLRVVAPAPGLARVWASDCGGAVLASIYFYFYGVSASTIAQRDEPAWRNWLNERLAPQR